MKRKSKIFYLNKELLKKITNKFLMQGTHKKKRIFTYIRKLPENLQALPFVANKCVASARHNYHTDTIDIQISTELTIVEYTHKKKVKIASSERIFFVE